MNLKKVISYGFLVGVATLYGFMPLSQVHATTLQLETTLFWDDINNYTTSLVGQASGNTARAQQITFATVKTLSAVRLGVLKSGSPTDNLVVTLRADASGSPSTTALATATISGTSLTSAMSFPKLTFDVPVTMTATVPYWIHVARSTAVNGSNFYRLYYDSASDAYASNSFKVYNGTSWSGVNYDAHVTYYEDYEIPAGGGGSFLTAGGVGTAQASQLEMTVNEDGDVANIGLTNSGWELIVRIAALLLFFFLIAIMLFAISFFYKKARYK